MKKIPISAKGDFLERLAIAAPVKAVSELIWNGLDAGATEIRVDVGLNALGAPETICISDNGSGIEHADIEILFGNLGSSWKKTKNRSNGRSLHGKSGQGRFKAFSLGSRVKWATSFKGSDGSIMQYTIQGDGGSLESMSSSSPAKVDTKNTGTTVTISNIQKNHPSLVDEEARTEFAKIFAPYLSQYPDVTIYYCGDKIDPNIYQDVKHDILLGAITLPSGKVVSAVITIVEWAMPTDRELHLCDADGVSLHEAGSGVKIHAPGFNFTVYIKCDHFKELDRENLLIFDELNEDVKEIIKIAKKEVRGYFRKRLADQQSQIVERWKQEEIYPFENKAIIDPIEIVERQVFDILAVNLEEYLPSFENSDSQSKRFVFRLLAQAIKENPASVQQIITEVLNLKKEEQDDLAELMMSTPLSNIISSAKIVANRLNFLTALENLLFDSETKKSLLERDQLHKILEKEAWIFDEEFALAGSEQRLEEVLAFHLEELGKRCDDDSPVEREGGKQGRIDLMLSRANKPRHDEYDHLVVELKRPAQKINSTILSQVESYAIAVAADPRFLSEKTRWKFIVVSNEMDEYAKRKCNERNKPSGLIYDDGKSNIQVWGFTWTEIISKARVRLQFINQSLNYEATRDTSRPYLEKVHAKFIPVIDCDGQDVDESNENT